jgi:phosphate transport system substrate-binding protein
MTASVTHRFKRSPSLYLVIALLLGCLGALSSVARDSGGSSLKLNGAGATFPQPIYSKWFHELSKESQGLQVNYQAIGSGGGVRQLLEGTVDFGASDEVLKTDEEAKVAGGVLHLPTVLGAVVVTYNLNEIKDPIQLSAETLGDIYLGKIQSWDDARIQKENPGIRFPKLPITVVFRSDGSGTTAIFTDFLTQRVAPFAKQVGQGKSVAWPAGVGAKGNAGVAGVVSQTRGALGYVELVFALSNKLPAAKIQNLSGSYVAPNSQSLAAAADGQVSEAAKKNFKINLVNSNNKSAYPITSLTWLLIPRATTDANKRQALARMAQWVVSDKAQSFASEMNYAPLPQSLRKQVSQAAAELDPKVLAR